ncbi:AraC family transcriptional regulator [Paenibacillus sp. 1P07SE]|uniref:AraC family transcriptional regulator n=1 Tax=Paenibacillus sp. 1P07SE TaxID=3132209 RepID=UPI0039A66CE3
MSRHQPTPAMGVLGLSSSALPFELTRHAPEPALSHLVLHYWVVSWNLHEGQTFDQDVVPNPCVNLVIEQERSGIYGPASSKYTKQLYGRGLVFGVKFKPGGFYPFWREPVAALADRVLTLAEVFGADSAEGYAAAMVDTEETSARIRLTDKLLLAALPPADPDALMIQRVVAQIREDRSMTRVEQLCQPFGMNIRKLQRMFHRYVGISPKWVIKLYRLQDAAERLEEGACQDWKALALELGYYDQAHFINDFKAVVGWTPDVYSSRFHQQ